MKTILIATDFSQAAHHAFAYGAELAQGTNARIVLLHVCQPVLITPEILQVITDKEMVGNAETELEAEVKQLAIPSALPIETKIAIGNAVNSIVEEAAACNADLIIVGMKNDHKTFRKFFGSTATALSRSTPIPMIVVPEGTAYTAPVSIALATELSKENDLHLIEPLCRLAGMFNGHISLVRVSTQHSEEKSIPPDLSLLSWHLRQFSPTIELIDDSDIAHGLNKFVKAKQVDMVVMVSQEYSFVERLLHKSDIKEMMLTTDVPVMILPGNHQYRFTKKEKLATSSAA